MPRWTRYIVATVTEDGGRYTVQVSHMTDNREVIGGSFTLDGRHFTDLDEANEAARAYALSVAGTGHVTNPVEVNVLGVDGRHEEELV